MKGLLIKEGILLKMTIRMQLITLAFFAVIGIATKNLAYLAMMATALTGNLCVSSLNYDAAASWNSYAATFPLRRSTLISVKYVLMYLLAIGATGIVLLIGIPFSRFAELSYDECAVTGLTCGGLGLFAGSLNLLLCVKFGVKRAQIVAMTAYLVPFGCVLFLYYLSQQGIIDLSHVTDQQFYLVLCGLGIVVLAFSLFFWRLSCRILEKKDLA